MGKTTDGKTTITYDDNDTAIITYDDGDTLFANPNHLLTNEIRYVGPPEGATDVQKTNAENQIKLIGFNGGPKKNKVKDILQSFLNNGNGTLDFTIKQVWVPSVKIINIHNSEVVETPILCVPEDKKLNVKTDFKLPSKLVVSSNASSYSKRRKY